MLLAFAYESVRRSAAARDVVACLFLASFGLSKFGLLQHSNDGWKVPSAGAAIYARLGAALSPLHELQHARRVQFFFWLCKTRDEAGGRGRGRRRTQSTVPSFGTKAGTCLRFWGIRSWSCSSLLCFPSPKTKASLFGQFHAENASIDCSTTAFTIVCAA